MKMREFTSVILTLLLLTTSSCSDNENSKHDDPEKPDIEGNIVDFDSSTSDDESDINESQDLFEQEKQEDSDISPEKSMNEIMAQKIKDFWGEAPLEEDREFLFDIIQSKFSSSYAGFVTGHIDWDEVSEQARQEVMKAESFGEFYAVLSRLFRKIQDGHVYISSKKVCNSNVPNLSDRPPLFLQTYSESMLGVCVTLSDENELFVYKANENNPVGLQPGDTIIGYDGKIWSDILDDIDSWNLPICTSHFGATGSANVSQRYLEMVAVQSNPHLFKELNYKKYDSDTALSFNTDELLKYQSRIECTDQIKIKDIDIPSTKVPSETLTWGKIPDTNIGYIAASVWDKNYTSEKFSQAVLELFDSDGLIIDFRLNMGGYWDYDVNGVAMLFNEDIENIVIVKTRASSSNYIDMKDIDSYGVKADPNSFYDKPIAVLTGPKAISGGDIFPYIMSKHPHAKRFGRATNGAFGTRPNWLMSSRDSIIGDLLMDYTNYVDYSSDGELLQAKEITPEVDVWLQKDDVAKGIDTVVEKAVEWIKSNNSENIKK